MPFRPLKSFLPTADDMVGADLPRLGEILLVHLNSYDGKVKQHGILNREYLRAMLENRNVGLGPQPPAPEYGDRQPEVTRAVMEAFDWLVSEGMLSHAPQPGDWFAITRKGEELLRRFGRYEHLETLGLEQVKADLERTGGLRVVVGGPGVAQMAWEWVRMKQGEAMLPAGGLQCRRPERNAFGGESAQHHQVSFRITPCAIRTKLNVGTREALSETTIQTMLRARTGVVTSAPSPRRHSSCAPRECLPVVAERV